MSLSTHRVVVLRGGPSAAYDDSLRTGKFILDNLPSAYEGIDVLVDKQGEWHVAGFPKLPGRILHHADLVWNALHAHADQTSQLFGVDVIGPAGISLAAVTNKAVARDVFAGAGIRMPHAAVVRAEDFHGQKETHKDRLVRDVFASVPHPARVSAAGVDVAIRVQTLPELSEALGAVFAVAGTAIVEEEIAGRHAMSGVIGGYRGEDEYVLPVMDVQSRSQQSFLASEKEEVARLALLAHHALGTPHYSQSEVVIHPRRGVFLLDSSPSPILHDSSTFMHSLGLVGGGAKDFVQHVINQNI